MSKSYRPAPGESGPWEPVEDYYLDRVRAAGGSLMDLAALAWCWPGSHRRRLCDALEDLQFRREEVIEKAVAVIESLPRITWQRTVFVEMLKAKLPVEIVERWRPHSWKIVPAVVVIVRPDLAVRIRRGSVGCAWTHALARSGWDPARPDAREGSQLLLLP
jgi:hypothetical protein